MLSAAAAVGYSRNHNSYSSIGDMHDTGGSPAMDRQNHRKIEYLEA